MEEAQAEFHASEGRAFESWYYRTSGISGRTPFYLMRFNRSTEAVSHYSWTSEYGRNSLAVHARLKVNEHEWELARYPMQTSIKAFSESGYQTDTYMLLHNRIPSDQEFERQLNKSEDSCESGQVRGLLLDYQRLIHRLRRNQSRMRKLLSLNTASLHSFPAEHSGFALLQVFVSVRNYD